MRYHNDLVTSLSVGASEIAADRIMNRFPKIGEPVEVRAFIGKEFENDKIGTVVRRNGEYIYVKLNKSGIEFELYTCELNEITPP